jgi:HPt (histidine-containing phosphotransfer) domain-containing protein
MWSVLLEPTNAGWRDAVHTIRGAAAGIGAEALASVCAEAEAADQALAEPCLNRVRSALDVALADVAAWRHELVLRSLKA